MEMDTKHTVRMNPGAGEASYARNSLIQSARQTIMKPLIEEAINELCCITTPPPTTMVITDLGSSCGPSALTLVSDVVDAIRRRCLQLQQAPPELSLFLNDLPGNDFNTLVHHLAVLQHRNLPLVTTSIVPGSFYGRLFTSGSVHLFLSSSSLHWLSQAPEDLVKNGIPMYHANEKMWQKMRPVVLGSYARQFRKDFMLFLVSRAQEMVPGGRMVLSLKSMAHAPDPANEFTQMWELVARILAEMASRGVVDEGKLKTFYIPLYAPYEDEIKEIIEEQGSFSITGRVQVHDGMIGLNKDLVNPKTIAFGIRACFEPIIVDHFGPSGEIVDEFVRTVEQDMMNLANYQQELANKAFVTFCLARRS
ncbi:unnamed protein product [Urochloa decumbens]|uniref:Uncharacterized protein n=1 Tax=Urochloa decumbens TaxID=240449 RepID=A0ABC9H244_9POAL